MNSPRSRFQKVGSNAEDWSKVSSSILFEEAVDAAMLQYLDSIPAVDLQGSAKIQGAKDFLRVLSTIGTVQTVETIRKLGELDYRVQQ